MLGDSEEAGEPKRLEQLQIDTLYVEGAHVLVAVELFSGYVLTAKLASQTSASMAAALEVGVFQALGLPVTIFSDGGSEFAGAVKATCTAHGIDSRHGMPHNSRSTSRAERSLRTLQECVAVRRVEGSVEFIGTSSAGHQRCTK